jgi:hypothetical protein
MNKKLIIMISMSLLIASTRRVSADFDVVATFTELANLEKNLNDPNDGITTAINKIITNGQLFRQYLICKMKPGNTEFKATVASGPIPAFPATNCDTVRATPGVQKVPLDVLKSLIGLLKTKIIGSETSPNALLYTILTILDRAGVPDVAKVKSVSSQIDSVMTQVEQVLNIIHSK